MVTQSSTACEGVGSSYASLQGLFHIVELASDIPKKRVTMRPTPLSSDEKSVHPGLASCCEASSCWLSRCCTVGCVARKRQLRMFHVASSELPGNKSWSRAVNTWSKRCFNLSKRVDESTLVVAKCTRNTKRYNQAFRTGENESRKVLEGVVVCTKVFILGT